VDNLFRLNDTKEWDPDIDQWLADQRPELGAIALEWYSRLRECGDDVRELLHDGHPIACVSDIAFCYVNVFKAHVNLGFFRGAKLDDPQGLLTGTGKQMRHVKLRPSQQLPTGALNALIAQAYKEVRVHIL